MSQIGLECQTDAGREFFVKPWSARCVNALVAWAINNIPATRERFYVPNRVAENPSDIKDQFIHLSNSCAHCPVLAQALLQVVEALKS